MLYIENENIRVGVKAIGAELASLQELSTGIEYMWQANDPRFWSRHSSILFPVIGAVNRGIITVEGKEYVMDKHGFARNSRFVLVSHGSDSMTWQLVSSKDTRWRYPFEWRLRVTYRLIYNGVSVIYEVTNEGTDDMPFSIGGHPAFNCPMVEGLRRSDYDLVFERHETQHSPLITEGGLISEATYSLLEDGQIIHVSDELFERDALILRDFNSSHVTLQATTSELALRVSLSGFRQLGIWSSHRDAPFVCIEPWLGMADPVGFDGELAHKPGMIILQPDEMHSCIHDISIVSSHSKV